MSAERLFRLLFPPRCSACGELLDPRAPVTESLCPVCRKEWETGKAEKCLICGKAITACACVTDAMEKAKCEGLRKTVFYLAGERKPVQNRILFRVKRTRDRRAIAFLASELLPAVSETLEENGILRTDVVFCYVPRTKAAVRDTGTDQARQLARELGKRLGIPSQKLILRVGKGTKDQKTLSVSARVKNADASFAANSRADIRGKHIFLVDDIVTSGASMAACARRLRRAGAASVHCFSVATDAVNREFE